MKEQENLKTTVFKLYNAGTKVKDIVTQTGVPRGTVYYWIKNGISKEMSPLNLRDYHLLKQKCERQEKIIAILKSAPCAGTYFSFRQWSKFHFLYVHIILKRARHQTILFARS